MRKVIIPNKEILSQVGEMVKAGATVTLQVKGNSMLPFIVNERDSVVLAPIDSELKPLDMVLALIDGDIYALHRVVKLSGHDVWTCGDGNRPTALEHCTIDRVAGRAVSIIRNGRTIDCHSKSEMRRVRLWHALSPVRRYLLAAYRLMFRKRIYHKTNTVSTNSKD
jgi:hypothetical protein